MSAAEDLAKVIASMEKRIRLLERTVYRTGRHDEMTFSIAGDVDDSISNAYRVKGPSKIVSAAITIKTPSTTQDSELTVYLDGIALGVVAIPASTPYVYALLPDNTNENDGVLTIQMTTVGAGMAGVTVSVEVA